MPCRRLVHVRRQDDERVQRSRFGPAGTASSATLLPGNLNSCRDAGAYAPALTGPRLPSRRSATAGRVYVVRRRAVFLPQRGRGVAWLEREGPPVLLLPVPIVGDALCAASGWLRQNARARAVHRRRQVDGIGRLRKASPGGGRRPGRRRLPVTRQTPDRFQGARSFDDVDVITPGERRGEVS
jgi:hypothetical protein